MRISIVTITYNNPDELKLTLASLPEFDFIESVIINGGSDSGTLEFLENYNGKVINEKDSGIADAFNKGIKYSSGDAIMYLNSGDVLINPDYLLSAKKMLEENSEISFIHSNILFNDMVGGEIFMRPQMKNLGRGLPYLHPTMIVRKSVFNEIGNFDSSFNIGMDFDFVVRLAKNHYKGSYMDGKAVVKMDGAGKSAIDEFEAIKECYRSLKRNDYLNLTNSLGFIIRVKFYFFRKIIVALGGRKILRVLKKMKHSE